jgi:endonuclease G
MAKKLFFALLLFHITFIFPCDLPGHFDFVVSNDTQVQYYGCYDAEHKGPHIVEYVLTKERMESESVRRPSATFTRDRDGGVLQNLLLENGYSLPAHSDYTNSGYDRGHMAPNADFNDTRENALLTFFIANIWPQTPNVNRVIWLKTENETRKLAVMYLIVKVVIIVDQFSDEKVKDIQVPLCFKRMVYDLNSEELIYEVEVLNEFVHKQTAEEEAEGEEIN